MKIGAVAATAANVLLLTFFIFQSFQSPFGRKGQDGALLDMQRQAMMAAEEHFKLGSPSAESYFKTWIKKDLSTWAQRGIAQVPFLSPCSLNVWCIVGSTRPCTPNIQEGKPSCRLFFALRATPNPIK